MRRLWAYAATGICAGIALGLLLMVAGNPVLYPVGEGEVTQFHADPTGMALSRERDHSAALVPLMTDIATLRGSITLHIRENDLAQAGEELNRLTALSGSYSSLVVSLDMNQSELEAYRTANDQNIRSLRSLVRDRGRLEDLQRLEVQFRDDRDPAMLSAVIVEGATLHKMIEEEAENAQNTDSFLSRVDAKLNITPAGKVAPQEELGAIVSEMAGQRQEWEQDLLAVRTSTPSQREKDISAIRVQVFPETAEYGVPFRVSGQVLGRKAGERPLEVLLDYTPVMTTTTGTDGSFEVYLPADNLTEGSHSILLRTGSARSDLYLVSVRSVPAVLTLTATVQEEGAAFKGVLMTGSGMPVRDVPVAVLVDGAGLATAQTGADGGYSGKVPLERPQKGNRTYILQASFEAADIPVHPATSPRVAVKVGAVHIPIPEGASSWPIPILVGAGIVALSCACAAWYLLHRSAVRDLLEDWGREREGLEQEGGGGGPPDRVAGGVRGSSHTPLLEPAQAEAHPQVARKEIYPIPSSPAGVTVISPRELEGDPRQAVHQIYRRLRAIATEEHRVSPSLAFTPREFCRQLMAIFPSNVIREFTLRYEQAEYARDPPGPAESEGVLHLFHAVLQAMRGSGGGGDGA